MAYVVALSGVGNTGKSTLINTIQERTKEYKVLVLTEIARSLFHLIQKDNLSNFQECIFWSEKERFEQIQDEKHLYDLIITDRTRIDQLAYLNFNMIKGKIKTPVAQYDLGEVYDKVYLFNTPIKDNTKFKEYNDELINNLMTTIVSGRFEGVCETLKNGKDNGDYIINSILKKLQ